MAGLFRWVVVAVVLGSLSVPTQAVDFEKVGMFGVGLATGVFFHELGHASLAVLNGGKVEGIQFSETHVTGLPSNEAAQWMLLGGYIFQSAATEVIIENKEWHDNAFALGWMSVGLYADLSNPIQYYFFGKRDNDLGLYEKAGGNPVIPAILMTTYAGWTIYRMFNQTDIPLYVTKDMLGITIKF